MWTLSAQYRGTTLTDYRLKGSSLAGMASAKLEGSGDLHYLYHQCYGTAPRHHVKDAVQRVQKECCDAPAVTITRPDIFSFEGFYEGTDNLYAIYSAYDRKVKTYGLYVNAVSKTQHTAEWNPKPVFEAQNVKRGALNVRVAISPDGSKAALMISPSSRDLEMRRVPLMVLDEKREIQWESGLEFTGGDTEYQILDMVVNNEGVIFLAVLSYRMQNRRYREEETFLLYEVTASQITCISQPIDFGFLCNARLLEKGNGDVAAGGYFTNSLKSKPQGVYMMVFDHDSAFFRNISYQQFPEEYYHTRPVSLLKFKPASMSVEADGLYEFADGTMVMLGEQRQVLTNTQTSNTGMTTTNYFYHSGDILVHFADSDGALGEMSMIHKYQISGPRVAPTPLQELRCYGYSNFVIREGDQLQLFFADDVDNYDGKIGEPVRGFNRKTGLAGCTVTSDRIVSEPKLLFTPKENDINISQPLFITKEGLLVIGLGRDSVVLVLMPFKPF